MFYKKKKKEGGESVLYLTFALTTFFFAIKFEFLN